LPALLFSSLLAGPVFALDRVVPSTGPLPIPAPPVPDPVEYQADHFEYEGSTSGADALIRLRGAVELRGSTWTLRAEDLRLDMRTRRAKAEGSFELDDGLTVLRGRSGEFDLPSSAGTIEDVKAEYPPWRVWAREGSLSGDRKGSFRQALFTSCDGSPPHYFFRSSRLSIRPGKRLTATNVRFHVGRIPLFYSPFLWKSLDDERLLRTRFIPGYDKRNGLWLKTNTLFSITPSMYGKLFLDYYGNQGIASGSELQFHPSEEARGALYGYRIKEEDSQGERWTVLGSYYQTLGSSFAVQGRLQAQSDPEVNNHYMRANAFRVTTELVNGAALVRRTRMTTTRLSYSRLDSGDPSTGGFRREKESYPRLDFQTAQLSWKRVPALFTVTAFADNDMERERNFYQRSAGARVEATQTKRLARGVSLTPRVAVRELYESRRDAPASFGSTRTYRDAMTAFYEAGTNLRVDTPIGDWDAGYVFERRFKVGAAQEDYGAPDHGIETNAVTLQHTWRPDRRLLMRTGSGYDFRVFRDRTLGFRDRVHPFVSDIVLLPRRGVQVSLRDSYALSNGNRAFTLQTDFGERPDNFFGVGLTHTKDRSDTYFSSTEAGWRPPRSRWRMGGALREQVRTPGGFGLRGFQVFEKELWLVRDFHDFYTKALIRFRPGGVSEGHIRIELRYDRKVERRVEKKDWEEEWFPWRQ